MSSEDGEIGAGDVPLAVNEGGHHAAGGTVAVVEETTAKSSIVDDHAGHIGKLLGSAVDGDGVVVTRRRA
jgi:hypothetical protein